MGLGTLVSFCFKLTKPMDDHKIKTDVSVERKERGE